MHLWINVLLSGLINKGEYIRKTFTFFKGEKFFPNRAFRGIFNKMINLNYISTKYFMDIQPITQYRIKKIIDLSRQDSLELMVHPENDNELKFLISPLFITLLDQTFLTSHTGMRKPPQA